MKTEIQYDLDGCSGVLVTTHASKLPSLWGLTILVGALLTSAALWLLSPWFFLVPALATYALFYGRGEAEKEHQSAWNTNDWVWYSSRVGLPFRVQGARLHLGEDPDAHSLDLQGAMIRSSEVGVTVSIGGFDPIELYWDEANVLETAKLARALQAVADRDHGTPQDVPETLTQAQTCED